MSVKRPPSKADIRRELQREVSQYLKKGGHVERVPQGVSGRTDSTPLKTVLFDRPRESRTYLNEVVAGIDQRKKPQKPTHTKRLRAGGRYRTIYDDFGEPIRKVWVDE